MTSLNFAPQWFKSSFSTPGGECVEVAGLPGKRMAVRDSKNPSGPVLEFSMDEWQGLVSIIKADSKGSQIGRAHV